MVSCVGWCSFGALAVASMISGSSIHQHAKVYCKCFEDNSGALELAKTPKLRPRTKHINIIYHHFRDAVKNGIIEIFAIETKDQIADILTKPLNQNLFTKHRKRLMFW